VVRFFDRNFRPFQKFQNESFRITRQTQSWLHQQQLLLSHYLSPLNIFMTNANQQVSTTILSRYQKQQQREQEQREQQLRQHSVDFLHFQPSSSSESSPLFSSQSSSLSIFQQQDHPSLFTSSQQTLILFNIAHHISHLIATSSPFETTENNIFNESELTLPEKNESMTVDEAIISQYLSQIIEDTQLEFECVLIAIIFLDRLSSGSSPSLPIHYQNWRNLLASCALLASKVYDDFAMSNADFRWVFPHQDLSLVNILELRILHLLSFQVSISVSIYDSYVSRYLPCSPSLSLGKEEQEEEVKGKAERGEGEGEGEGEEDRELLEEVCSVDAEEEIDSLMCDSYLLTDPDSTFSSSIPVIVPILSSSTGIPLSEEKAELSSERKGGVFFFGCLSSYLKKISNTNNSCSNKEKEKSKRRMRSPKKSKVHCCCGDDNSPTH
jgi:hypothetical protein